MNISKIYDKIGHIQELVDTANDLIHLGDKTDEQKAVILLTDACKVATGLIPVVKMDTVLQIAVDMAFDENKEELCTLAGTKGVSGFTSAFSSFLDAINDTQIVFDSLKQARQFGADIAFMSNGNVTETVLLSDKIFLDDEGSHPIVSISNNGSVNLQYPEVNVVLTRKLQIKTIDTDHPDGTSTIEQFEPDGTAETTDFNGPDGTGGVVGSGGILIGVRGSDVAKINPVGGTETDVGPSTTGVEGSATGYEAAINGKFYFLSSGNQLYTADIATGDIEANIPVSGTLSGFVADNSTGNLIGVDGQRVVIINPATGHETNVGASISGLNGSPSGYEAAANGNFYFVGNDDQLYTLNIETGQLINQVALSGNVGGFFADNATGELVGVDGSNVVVIDPTTGSETDLGSPIPGLKGSPTGYEAAANGEFYFLGQGSQLYTVDIASGNVVNNVSVAGGVDVSGFVADANAVVTRRNNIETQSVNKSDLISEISFSINDGHKTFVYKPHTGQDTISDFQITGNHHDILSLPSLNFSNIAQVLRDTKTVGGDAVIQATDCDTITLLNITKAELKAHRSDVAFHA